MKNRRIFFKKVAKMTGAAIFFSHLPHLSFPKSVLEPNKKMFFDISLAQWSLHKMLFSGKLKNLDFPQFSKEKFGISAVEYVSAFFDKKHKNKEYLASLKKRTDDLGVKNILIMVDREGILSERDKKKRNKAVENHYSWVEAAKFLGCHAIRVNLHSDGPYQEVQENAIDGLGKLASFGEKENINIIVENHGGYSSNGKWLSEVIKKVNKKNCGTLPDFGNFTIEAEKGIIYPYLLGIAELLPFAKGVSAKSYDFDKDGNEIFLDYKKLLTLVQNSGYTGYIGIEYEGDRLSEEEGIRKTKALLEKIREQLSK